MDVKKLRIVLASSLSSLTLLFGILGFSGLLNDFSSNKRYVNWLKDIDDHTLIRDIDMPGSHNTMAKYSLADVSGQCQTLSLNEQLNLGVRFLDIRLKEDHGTLKAVHSIIDQRATFHDISKTVVSFLKKNPSEFIMMSIKEESNNELDFEKTLLKDLDDDVYLKDQKSLPTYLEEIRGKVLILSRYKNASIGIKVNEGWRDSNSFTLSNDIYIQDTYRVKDVKEKKEAIINCFNESGHALKINYLSGYIDNIFPPSNAMSVAKDINPWINKEIDNYQDRGIVLYDYINEKNMHAFFKEANN